MFFKNLLLIALFIGICFSIPVEEEKQNETTPYIPENKDILTELKDSCTKEHLILGNHVTNGVCDHIYKACTSQELMAVIVNYYAKDVPVSIEYSINEIMNKEAISEKCGTQLVGSKIFKKETVVIPSVSQAQKVEKVTKLNQDLPSSNTAPISDSIQVVPSIQDGFAEVGELGIKKN